MQPDDDGNAHMENHDFDGGADQRWELIHVGDGYYNVVNASSELYLTALVPKPFWMQ